ncbi:thioredoxin family protein [Clostridium sp. D53t1_180928_C8]|uniref:thioredoxin domain-containing protein n=1 Tax=Clostridium sp. D53t1_180928_C8 TaxID=2787101 RepID=UPI0018A9EC24
MKKLINENEIIDLINNNEISVVYFTGMDCGACEAIKFKIESILKELPQIKSGEINGEENLELAAKYGVFSLPIFLLFIEGKESLRVGRNVDLLELERSIRRYYEMIF